MFDLEERLRSSAGSWQRNVDAGAKPLGATRAIDTPRPQRPRTRVLAPAFSILAVLLVATGAAFVVVGKTEIPSGHQAYRTQRAVVGGIRFSIPARWHVLDKRALYRPESPISRSLMKSLELVAVSLLGPVERWNDRAVERPCTYAKRRLPAGGYSIKSCPGAAGLRPGGISVTFSVYKNTSPSHNRPSIRWNTTVAGRPARVSTHDTGCPTGVPGREFIVEPSAGVHVYMSACFGPDSTENRQAFNRAVRTARLD